MNKQINLYRILFIVIFIKISFLGYAQQANQYTFDKTTFNQINSKKHKDGLYLSFNDLIQETNSFGNQFEMVKSLDTIIFEDKYETYTIEYEDNEKMDSILVDNKAKKETNDIEFDKKEKDKQRVFPLICFNDTFYYLIYHDFNKKEYNYAQIPKDKPFHTINLLIPIELYNFYQRKNEDKEIVKYIVVWNFGDQQIKTTTTYINGFLTKPSRNGFNHLKSKSNVRFDQWGSIVDNYILSTFIFSPVYGGIIEASYNRVNDILEQKPLLKAQIDDREMVDVGDGMQMPKYKYTRTTVYKLIDKLNEKLLKY
jgi:hypothetical protein